MPSRIYRRPRPLGATVGVSGYFTLGPGVSLGSVAVRYDSVPIAWPGIWQVYVQGAGGGGGGFDTFYSRNGEAGARGSYSTFTRSISGQVTATVGRGGAAGADSNNGGAAGITGGSTSLTGNVTTASAAGGAGGRGGAYQTSYNRMPQTSLWPFGPFALGTGGQGRIVPGANNTAYDGALLMKLVG